MFTGIIQQTGTVEQVRPREGAARLTIGTSGWRHEPSLGQSIAVNGCCLTVAAIEKPLARGMVLGFDIITQTLAMTTLGSLVPGQRVNLEHAVTPVTLMDGHMVQGHVDGVGVVVEAMDEPGQRRVRIEPPRPLMAFVFDQGSVAVDGVSLTVARTGGAAQPGGEPQWFEVALIPTTLRLTNLGERRGGSHVNVEVDCVAKMVVTTMERMSRRK